MREFLQTRKFYVKLLMAALLLSFFSCKDDQEGLSYSSITLKVDKPVIEADGQDVVKFTVFGDDTDDITSMASVWIDQRELKDKTYSTDTEGSITFTATYKTLVSNTVTVTASSQAGKLTLKVSRPDVTANGTDVISFTVLNSGKDVTESATISGEYTGDLKNAGESYAFSSSYPGSYSFYAELEGKRSETVYVSAVPENAQFYRMVGTFKTTSVWCEPCTGYNATLEEVEKELPHRMTKVVIHGKLGKDDPYQPDRFSEVCTGLTFGKTSFPSHNFDFRSEYLTSGNYPKENVLNTLNTILNKYPATTGFHVTSTINETKATAKVTVRASQPGEYWLGIMLVEDGLIYSQAQYVGDYTHNNTFRSAVTPYKGLPLGRIESGGSVTSEFTIDLKNVEEPGNCKLVLYTLSAEYSTTTVVNNAAYAKLGEVTDFEYESNL